MMDRRDSDTVPFRKNSALRKPGLPDLTGLFLLVNAVLVLTFFGPLRDLVRISLRSDYDSYIPLIPFISAYALYSTRKTIFSSAAFAPASGLPVMAIGILLFWVGRSQAASLDPRDYLDLTTFCAVTFWVGGFVLCYGIRSSRMAAFPLLFLFLTVPIPNGVLEYVIHVLQTGSAEVAYRLFQAVGIPVARDGFIFHLPTLDIEVAKQCSGIRSSLSLMITGLLAGQLFLTSGRARTILVLSTIPLAIVKNGIRIFTLSTLALYADQRILASDLHRKGGIVFFILALLLLWAVIVLLKKTEQRGAMKDA